MIQNKNITAATLNALSAVDENNIDATAENNIYPPAESIIYAPAESIIYAAAENIIYAPAESIIYAAVESIIYAAAENIIYAAVENNIYAAAENISILTAAAGAEDISVLTAAGAEDILVLAATQNDLLSCAPLATFNQPLDDRIGYSWVADNHNKHCGWTNYATWRINLECFHDNTADDVGLMRDNAEDAAQILRDWFENVVMNEYPESMVKSYCQAFVDDVNWREIAQAKVEEMIEAEECEKDSD